MREALATFDRHRSPRARLIAFTREVASSSETVARHGCPHGTLCTELDKRDDDLPEAAAILMRLRVDWAREQFGSWAERMRTSWPSLSSAGSKAPWTWPTPTATRPSSPHRLAISNLGSTTSCEAGEPGPGDDPPWSRYGARHAGSVARSRGHRCSVQARNSHSVGPYGNRAIHAALAATCTL